MRNNQATFWWWGTRWGCLFLLSPSSSSSFPYKIARMHLFVIILQTMVHRRPRHGEIRVPLCTSFLLKNKMPLSHRYKMLMSRASVPTGNHSWASSAVESSGDRWVECQDSKPYCDQVSLGVNGMLTLRPVTAGKGLDPPTVDNCGVFAN